MNETRVNLWEVEADLRVISTNPIVNSRGQAVMGRGCAKEAKEKIPGLEFKFATLLQRHGNRVMRLCRYRGADLASFPVKHHWREDADPNLIECSAAQLVALADKFGYQRIVLPRPGCGNGQLSWVDVQPILEHHLDGRFTVVTFPQKGDNGRPEASPERPVGFKTGISRRVIFCGSRTWSDPEPIRQALKALSEGTFVTSGGARGADRIAEREAKAMGLPVEVFEARWDVYGRAAGYRRNETMLGLPGVEKVLAFRRGDVSKGTDHMVEIARKAGVEVSVVVHK